MSDTKNGNGKKQADAAAPRPDSEYVVLQQVAGTQDFTSIGLYKAPDQARAKQRAAAELFRQGQLTEEGVTLVAVPKLSWKPTTAKVHQPEPVVALS